MVVLVASLVDPVHFISIPFHIPDSSQNLPQSSLTQSVLVTLGIAGIKRIDQLVRILLPELGARAGGSTDGAIDLEAAAARAAGQDGLAGVVGADGGGGGGLGAGGRGGG